jgi:hypothetical protein
LLGDVEVEEVGDPATTESYRQLVQTYAQEKMILQQLIRSKTLANQLRLTRHYGMVTAGEN